MIVSLSVKTALNDQSLTAFRDYSILLATPTPYIFLFNNIL